MDDLPPLVDRPDDHGYPTGFSTGIAPSNDAWPRSSPQTWPPQSQYPANPPYGVTPSEHPVLMNQWPMAGGAGPFPMTQWPSGGPPQFTYATAPIGTPAMPAGWGSIPNVPGQPPPLAMGGFFGQPPPPQDDDWVDVSADRPNWESVWPQGGFPTSSGGLAPRPLSRATSRTSHTSRRRAGSFSHSANTSPGSSYSPMLRRYSDKSLDDEKRPPREWRVDFSMKRPSPFSNALARVLSPALGRHGSIRQRSSSISTPKVDMHGYLVYNSSQLRMSLDLRLNVNEVRFAALNRPLEAWDLTRFACEPPLHKLKLWNPYYPWLIEVVSGNPVGITLHELFLAIWNSMMTPIAHEDYYNVEMNETIRSQIAMAFNQRVGMASEERSIGVRRVDFLMDKVHLLGFEIKGKDSSVWEMKIKKITTN